MLSPRALVGHRKQLQPVPLLLRPHRSLLILPLIHSLHTFPIAFFCSLRTSPMSAPMSVITRLEFTAPHRASFQ
jgi:hypothetical protein